jgi:multidrug efflux system membrane fusion protein
MMASPASDWPTFPIHTMNMPTSRPPTQRPLPARRTRRLLPLGAALLGAALWWQLGVSRAQHAPGGAFAAGAQPVTVAPATVQAVPVWLSALGTVTSRSLVSVMPRVAGQLQSVDYRQGQLVHAGQVLARIDDAPFRIAVEQAQAQFEQARAQFDGAQRDLDRYQQLLKQDSISAQQVSDQTALVAQDKALVDADQAALDNARLQLQWTRITAPTAGITGLRPVDAGNMVSTSGALGSGNSASSGTASSGATPVAVVAQVQPIDVTFALPQQQLGAVLLQIQSGAQPAVQAWDAGNARLIDSGRLYAADNQISTSTGTLNLRAVFANKGLSLLPNQFVNVRLLVRTIPGAIVVPTTAVAVGAPGTYVYVLGAGGKVALRKVATGVTWNDLTQIVTGLQPGERVVTDGLDRLRDGAAVRVVQAHGAAVPAAAASRARGAHHAWGGHAASGAH